MTTDTNLELSHFDNRVISITGVTESELAHALALFVNQRLRNPPHVKAFRVSATHGMVLYWSAPDKDSAIQRFPFPMSFELLVLWLRDWLLSVEYPDEPDIDGSVKKGWRMYNEGWTHVDGDWRALCAVQPVWAMYGK